jgi:hypothetical protein
LLLDLNRCFCSPRRSSDARLTSSPLLTITPRASLSRSPGSLQAASLGRDTQPPLAGVVMGIVPRNSENTSKGQSGSGWNDERLGILRKFAAEVEDEFNYSNDSKEVVISRDSEGSISLLRWKPKQLFSSIASITYPVPHRHSSIYLAPFPSVVKHQFKYFY